MLGRGALTGARRVHSLASAVKPWLDRARGTLGAGTVEPRGTVEGAEATAVLVACDGPEERHEVHPNHTVSPIAMPRPTNAIHGGPCSRGSPPKPVLAPRFRAN